MLLVYLTMDSTTYRISTELLTLENPFLPKIYSFTSPRRTCTSDYGGLCNVNYGKISFMPDFFEDDWPPPKELEMEAYYSNSTEASKQLIFEGMIYLTGLYKDRVEYNLFTEGITTNVLSTSVSYASGTDSVEVPMILGTTSYFPALRLQNNGSYYNFHDAYLTSSYTIYDDGVDITANATKNAGTNSFYLNPNPAGTVSISGTSSKATTFGNFLTWAASQAGFAGALTFLSVAVGTSTIKKEITNQIKIMDLIDDVIKDFGCVAYYTNLAGFLIVVELNESYHSTSTYNEYEIFNASISHNPPVKNVSATLLNRVAKTDPVNVVETEIPVTVTTSESYAVDEITLNANSTSTTTIQTDLQRVADIQGLALISATIPLEFPFPLPGTRFQISITEDSFLQAMDLDFTITDITYNFDKEEITAEGPGTYTST